MLIFTGTINGKEYKEQSVSAVEIAKLGDLPEIPKNNQVLNLRLRAKRIGRNRAENNAPVVPRSFRFPAVFQGQMPDGSSFTLRWATNSKPGKNGAASYSPSMCEFEGQIMAFSNKRNQYEKFVYFALHPHCATSPFVGSDTYFEMFDPAAEAQAMVERQKLNAAMLNEILTVADDAKIRIKAMGLSVNGQTVSVGQHIPTQNIRLSLANLFQQAPDEFAKQWNTGETILRGLLTDAMYSGVVEHVPNAQGGRAGWVWRKGTWEGQIATFTSINDDAFRALSNWAASNYDAVMEYLLRNLDADTANSIIGAEGGASSSRSLKSAPEAEPVSTKTASEILFDAVVQQGIVAYDRASKSVVWLDDNGEITGKPFLEGVEAKTWYTETKAFFVGQRGMWHRGEAKKKLEQAKTTSVTA